MDQVLIIDCEVVTVAALTRQDDEAALDRMKALRCDCGHGLGEHVERASEFGPCQHPGCACPLFVVALVQNAS